jgi:GrpB-like predicted nucleotidyltransferase (UPF0157 family)
MLCEPEAAAGFSDEPVRIVPYDPTWPASFEQERALLAGAIAGWTPDRIHHVGSTSVSGLVAKPIIDILVGVSDLESARACFQPLALLGYLYAPYRTEEMHWFCKPDPRYRTHHLHLVPADSSRFRDELLFRDHLRADPDLAAEYGELKRRLARTFQHDRDAYTDAKSDFIRAGLRRARGSASAP